MLIESVFYLVGPLDRPPYGWVADHLGDQKRISIQMATVARPTTHNGRSFPSFFEAVKVRLKSI